MKFLVGLGELFDVFVSYHDRVEGEGMLRGLDDDDDDDDMEVGNILGVETKLFRMINISLSKLIFSYFVIITPSATAIPFLKQHETFPSLLTNNLLPRRFHFLQHRIFQC